MSWEAWGTGRRYTLVHHNDGVEVYIGDPRTSIPYTNSEERLMGRSGNGGHWAVLIHWPSKKSRCGRSAGEPVSEQRFKTLSEALAVRQSFEDKELSHIVAGSTEGFRFVACLLSVDKDGKDRWQRQESAIMSIIKKDK